LNCGVRSVDVREKLRNIGVRLSELSTYLNVSRPTLYKYLELFENNEKDKIDKRTYDLLNYIDNSRGLTKPILMDHLYNNYIVTVDDDNLILKIKSLISNDDNFSREKINIIKVLMESKNTNEFIERINEEYGTQSIED